jgi:3-hydroxyacyl-CoA dehydrogenase
MTSVIETADLMDGVRIITINNPPVNAISSAVRTQLKAEIEGAGNDEDVLGVVLTGAGRAFVAGADIREFGKEPPAGTPTLPDVIHAIEDCPKPVVAAINGACAGGGLEIALGAHWRIAGPRAVLGLPEVNLGTIPGATGTQRLPRAAGVEAALDLIVKGELVPAKKARALGIVEAIEDDPVAAAAAMALQKPVRKLREDDSKLGDLNDAAEAIENYRKGMAKRWRGYEARFKAVDAVALVTQHPYQEAIRRERQIFMECQGKPEARGMRHAFFAERGVARVPGIPKETEALPVKQAGIIGCGTMGGGIAMNFANAGIPVTVMEQNQEGLDRGLEIVRKNYAGSVSRGRMTQEEMDKRVALISGTTSYDALADADIVIEAAFERMDIKKEIFSALEKVCKPEAILATNTSTLDVDEIASSVSTPERVVGTHFFSPANVMRLMENVRAEKTSDQTAQSVMKLAPRIGKVGVMVGVCDGFVGNRMLYAYTRQANFLLEEGALPAQVDRVLYEFGLPMGPFAMGDLAGIDVGYLVRQERLKVQGPTNKRTSAIADKLYELGRMGQKNGKGWYRYEEGNRAPISDTDVEDLVINTSAELGIERREISDEEILERCMFPLINEGAKILAEGIAARSMDIDMIWIFGYGFPRYRGGPMFWADEIGLDHVLTRLQAFWQDSDRDWLEPAPLLVELAKAGKGFKDWSA